MEHRVCGSNQLASQEICALADSFHQMLTGNWEMNRSESDLISLSIQIQMCFVASDFQGGREW